MSSVNIVLAFIFSSGKITKFTCGNIRVTELQHLIDIKKYLLDHLMNQLKKDSYVIPISNISKTDHIQIVTKNLNAINLYLQYDVNKYNTSNNKLVYSLIFNSGKVTKFTKKIFNTQQECQDFKINFNKEMEYLVSSIQKNEIYILENEDQSDFLFILPKSIDSFSINLSNYSNLVIEG